MTPYPKPPKRVKRPPKALKRRVGLLVSQSKPKPSKPLPRSTKPIKRGSPPKYSNAYTQPEWRAQVRRIRKRSGGMCEARLRCGGSPVDGDPHHLEYLPLKGKKRILVDDSLLVDCCRPCHLEFERRKDAGEPQLAGFLEGL